MTYRLHFEISTLPPTGNTKKHWRVVAKERSYWRNVVKLRVFMQRPPKPLEKCKLTCTRFSSSEPDYDNLSQSFKSVVDGLKDGGIILDDKPSVVIARDYRWERAKPKEGKISVLVEEAA